MVLTDGAEKLIVTTDAIDPHRGDFHVAVAVDGKGFRGTNDEVWLDRDDYDRFLDDLRRVECDRRGSATLVAMSPEDFQLTIGIVDRAGHASAAGWVGRGTIGAAGERLDIRVQFSFELDPSRLPEIVEQAQALARAETHRDILEELHSGRITDDEVNRLCDRVDPTEALENWGLSNAERTASAHGAGWSDLAGWRYKGWPSACAVCGGSLPSPTEYGWFVHRLKGQPTGLRHIGCEFWRDAPDLDEIRQKLEAAENSCDPEYIVGMMADDIVIMVPHAPVQEGKAACAAFVREVSAFFREELDRTITYVGAEARAIGNIGFDRGTFSFVATPRSGGDTTRAQGKYLWLYYCGDDDGWKLKRAIVSLDEDEETA